MTEPVALSEGMRASVRLAERVAQTNANVLITGESGTGKDFVARLIHERSPRAGEAFVKIDCAALPSELLEAELFGYERGAFTGASAAKPGRLEAAHKGTLVLDEIAHLSTDAQAKLLRIIERREFERLGGRHTLRVDARFIALTNVDPEEAIKRRVLREDLFYRLNVVRINVPPLRDRAADVRPLAQQFLKAASSKHGRRAVTFTKEALDLLQAYEFPGNVRELMHIVERAVIVTDSKSIEVSHLPQAVQAAVQLRQRRTQRLTLAELEADYIAETLAATKGNKAEAARLLGISRKNLYEKIARYRIEV